MSEPLTPMAALAGKKLSPEFEAKLREMGLLPPRPAVFRRVRKGTICDCGWEHGSEYNRELELEHRLEHLEGKW